MLSNKSNKRNTNYISLKKNPELFGLDVEQSIIKERNQDSTKDIQLVTNNLIYNVHIAHYKISTTKPQYLSHCIKKHNLHGAD